MSIDRGLAELLDQSAIKASLKFVYPLPVARTTTHLATSASPEVVAASLPLVKAARLKPVCQLVLAFAN
jgi:hypothetical protein